MVTACGLGIRDIARNTELDPQSQAAQDVWRVFTEITEYRLYEDLRRGWRVVQPNLEHVGLLRVGYRGLESVCADNARWQFHMLVCSAAGRQNAKPSSGPCLDQFRRKLAISCRCLHETNAAADSPAGRTAPQRVLGPRPERATSLRTAEAGLCGWDSQPDWPTDSA